MRRYRAFTLIELLVCVGIVALLLGILLPSIGSARREARGVKCANNLRQLGHAFHMYAAEFAGCAMPLAYTLGSGPRIYWWGTDTAGQVDHTRGFVWPYLRSGLRQDGLYECPNQAWGTYAPQGKAKAVTSTYGYNGYFLCPPHTPGWNVPGAAYIGDKPWQNVDTLRDVQRIFVFADTAIDLGGSRPRNNALLDPPWIFADGEWIENNSPTTCFRHAGRATVALADGHVQPFGLAGGRMASPRFQIGSVGERNDPHYVPDWRQW